MKLNFSRILSLLNLSIIKFALLLFLIEKAKSKLTSLNTKFFTKNRQLLDDEMTYTPGFIPSIDYAANFVAKVNENRIKNAFFYNYDQINERFVTHNIPNIDTFDNIDPDTISKSDVLIGKNLIVNDNLRHYYINKSNSKLIDEDQIFEKSNPRYVTNVIVEPIDEQLFSKNKTVLSNKLLEKQMELTNIKLYTPLTKQQSKLYPTYGYPYYDTTELSRDKRQVQLHSEMNFVRKQLGKPLKSKEQVYVIVKNSTYPQDVNSIISKIQNDEPWTKSKPMLLKDLNNSDNNTKNKILDKKTEDILKKRDALTVNFNIRGKLDKLKKLQLEKTINN